MLDLGWQERVPWKWKHLGLGAVLVLRRGFGEWQNKLKAVQHSLRESWRRACYYKWLGQDRIDNQLYHIIAHNDRRTKSLRFADLSSHELAVVSGAAVSPAKFSVMRASVEASYPWGRCSGHLIDWNLLLWECQSASRPPGIARDLSIDMIQVRLGWPSSNLARLRDDKKILA